MNTTGFVKYAGALIALAICSACGALPLSLSKGQGDRELDADLAEAGNDALDSRVFPPRDDDRLEFGKRSQMRDVLLDRSTIGRGLLHLGMERIDRRVPGVRLRERCVKVLMRQRVAQT